MSIISMQGGNAYQFVKSSILGRPVYRPTESSLPLEVGISRQEHASWLSSGVGFIKRYTDIAPVTSGSDI